MSQLKPCKHGMFDGMTVRQCYMISCLCEIIIGCYIKNYLVHVTLFFTGTIIKMNILMYPAFKFSCWIRADINLQICDERQYMSLAVGFISTCCHNIVASTYMLPWVNLQDIETKTYAMLMKLIFFSHCNVFMSLLKPDIYYVSGNIPKFSK
jgi:hypothetical protein